MDLFDRLNRFANQFGELIADDVRAHVELGAALLERGDLEGAIHELEQVSERRKDHPRALYLLGVAYLRRRALGDDERAEAALRQALLVREDFAEAHVALGQLKEQRGDLEGAAEAYRQALPLAPDAAMRREVERTLGALYLRTGRLDKAVRELRKAVAGDPDDAEAQGLLGQALIESAQRKGEPEGGPTWESARLCLQRAARADRPSARVLAALGSVLLQAGQQQDAERAFHRAVEADPQQVQALIGLGEIALQRGDVALAYEQALRGLSAPAGMGDVAVRLLLARCFAGSGNLQQALPAYERALEVAPAGGRERRVILEEGLHLALLHGKLEEAAALGRKEPLDKTADGLAAQAQAQALTLEQAEALVSQALGVADTVEVRLAQAALERRRGNAGGAGRALRRAAVLAPGDPRPRTLLRELYQSERGALPKEVYGLLLCAQRHLLRAPELTEFVAEVSQLVTTLDQPLLLTVMGEFNSGKSTFVNALLGEEVAPMGITPTTATINILKYGRERGGRVVYRDDSSRDVAWAEVPALLRALDEQEVRRIRYVEVLYPADMLQRVNVVDTPGLNSILPEHEQTAREFIAKADAVVWLCTVDQAGKATERDALRAIRDQGQHEILGVLNKIDRLSALQASDADREARSAAVIDPLAEVMKHLLDPEEGMGGLLDLVVPFSGRDALRGRLDQDQARLERSNLAALQAALNERFFARSQAIKREVARSRLLGLLRRAKAQAEGLIQRSQRKDLEEAVSRCAAEADRFKREVLAAERRRLIADSEEVHKVAARETLDFVRPRRWPFGENQASPADRDFLVGLLDEKLHGLAAASRERIVTALDERTEDVLRLLDEQVYGRYLAFARGYLRGGKVDDFFTRLLPRVELTEAAVCRALERDAPTSIDILEAELLTPLRVFTARRFAGLISDRRRALDDEDLRRFDLEERVIEPLDALLEALGLQ